MMGDVVSAKPLPVIDELTRPYWDAAAEGRLVVQGCEACGHRQLPAAHVCANCGSRALGWVEVSGRGEVHTFTIMHRAYHPAFADELPYNVSIVALEEGPLLLTNVVGVAPDALRVGQPVQVVFDPVAQGISLPRFAPVTGAPYA